MIQSSSQLTNFLDRASDQPQIGFDTEFLRVKTFFPRLCLLQVSWPGTTECVDPLPSESHERLQQFLQSYQGALIIHAASQDLEVLHHTYQLPPLTIFDTQVAAAMLGMGAQLSYAALVDRICGVVLEKSQTRTDWCKRPLTDAQIEYARGDVAYLPELHRFLSGRLRDTQRSYWLTEDCQASCRQYADPNVPPPPVVKGGFDLPTDAQHRLWRLMNWRESRARQRDLPREWVISSSDLVSIARRHPVTRAELISLCSSSRMLERNANAILEAMNEAAVVSPHGMWQKTDVLSEAEKVLVKKLQTELRRLSEQADVEATLVANRRSLENLVRGSSTALDSGWRHEFAGRHLKKLLAESF